MKTKTVLAVAMTFVGLAALLSAAEHSKRIEAGSYDYFYPPVKAKGTR